MPDYSTTSKIRDKVIKQSKLKNKITVDCGLMLQFGFPTSPKPYSDSVIKFQKKRYANPNKE